MQPEIGQRAGIARLAFPNDCRSITVAGLDIGIQAVIADVGFTARKPAEVRTLLLENLGKRLKPMQLLLPEFAPKTLGILFGPFVQGIVLLPGSNPGSRRKLLAGRKQSFFLHDVGNLACFGLRHFVLPVHHP